MDNEPILVDERPKRFGSDALLVAGAIILGSLIIAAALIAGNSARLMGAGTQAGDSKGTADAGAQDPTDTKATTSLDDDPVLGDKSKAHVAIVEFSDYECPFCQKFHKDTFPQIVKDYVESGKAIVTFRDFPLSFHEPNATLEASYAQCVRKATNDKTFFNFTQAVYQNTQANGQGLPAGKLDQLVTQAGANPQSVADCAKTQAVQDEIKKDIADGEKAGVSGTPSFIIGTLDKNGNVNGERIVGAAPYASFKTALDKYVK